MSRKAVALVFVFWAGLIAALPATGGEHRFLKGAGATFPHPLYGRWIEAYQQESNALITYDAVGSGNGIKQLLHRLVDFGATDALLTHEEMSQAPAEILTMPTCVGAVAITYNLPYTEGLLRLSPELVADIFRGAIKRWSDPKIVKMNPGLLLPDLEIRVAHRSDESGTTFIFTDYLSRSKPEWKEQIGFGKSVAWPTGIGADGNSGVIELVKKVPGSVGYVEHSYARRKGINVAAIRNEAERFIEPTLQSISAASRKLITGPMKEQAQEISLAEAYPICSFTYIIFYREQAYNRRSEAQARSLARFLWWAIHEGQSFNEDLLYAPLSNEAVKKAEVIVRAMTFAGKPVMELERKVMSEE